MRIPELLEYAKEISICYKRISHLHIFPDDGDRRDLRNVGFLTQY
jgi:hypothetical protein